MADPDGPNVAVTDLATPEATVAAGRALAQQVVAAGIDRLQVSLIGELGTGKTTFARGFLGGLGHCGPVPSPTYTLIEPYELGGLTVYHVDLYRLTDPREVEDLGLSELPGPGVVLLVEWPERAGTRLETADLQVRLDIAGDGRRLECRARSPAGQALLPGK
jgi:tRNA threonylcarbamoyladenosine biosynthesis protein TsaE